MITPVDVLTQINIMIEQAFPNMQEPILTDDTENNIRPYFMPSVLNSNIYTLHAGEKQHRIGIQLYYFPTNEHDYMEEILDVEQKIIDLFSDGFALQDIYIDPDEDGIAFDVNNGILNAIFYVDYYTEEDDSDQYDNIEELDYEQKLS